jgi:hypothetical protein
VGLTNEVVTRIIADNKQFDGAMRGTIQVMERFNKKGEMIGSTVKVMTKHMDDAAKKTGSFKDAMTALSRDIKVAGTIFNTLSGAIKGAYEAASDGAKIMAAEQFFKNAGKSIADYRKATNGMVSDAELMKKANLADSMGIDEKTFKKLVTVAEASALKTGQSFDYMFNSIIVGTARSSRLLLDNLGIIVSVGQANDVYAAKIGKTVGALSAEEKQIAFVEAVARKSQGTLDEYAKATDRTAESFAKFDSNVQNLIDSLKVGLAKAFAKVLPQINTVLSELLDLLREADWDLAGEYAAVRFLQGFTALLAKGEGFLPPGLVGKLFGVDATVFGALSREQGKYADSLIEKGKARAAGRQQEARWGAENNLAEIKRLTGADWNAAIQNYVDLGTAGIDEMTDKLIANFLRLNNKVDQMFGKWVKTPTDGSPGTGKKGRGVTSDPFEPSRDEQAMYGWGFKGKSLLESITNDTAKKLADTAKKGADDALDFSEGMKEALDYAENWAKIEREMFDERKKAEEEAQKQALEAAKELADEWRRMVNDLVAGTTAGVASGNSLFGAIGAGVGPMVGAAVGGPLGAALGALLPILGQMIDKLAPVIDLLAAVADGLGLFIQNGLSELLGALSLLSDPIQDLLAALGVLVGSALRPLVVLFTVLVGAVGAVISMLAQVIVALSPFIEMLAWVFWTFTTLGTAIFGLFFDLNTAVGTLKAGFDWFTETMLRSAIAFNNAIVKVVRSLGLKGFGKYLDREDFRGGGDPIDENTSAVNENTRALRDFAREFRNMPQNYKAFGAVYASQDPQMEWRGPRTGRGIGNRDTTGLQNARWRT